MENINNNAATATEELKKGSIWNIGCGKTSSTGTEIWAGRPGIIVSNEGTNRKAGFVNVVYLTTAPKRDMPFHVKVISDGKIATAMCEQIFAVDKSRLDAYMGQITQPEMLDIDKALLFSLGISNSLKPTSLFTKWIQALERYDINLTDQHDTDKESEIAKERDMYRELYEQEHRAMEKMLKTNMI